MLDVSWANCRFRKRSVPQLGSAAGRFGDRSLLADSLRTLLGHFSLERSHNYLWKGAHARKTCYPCLDVDRGRVVKGTNFVDLRDAGDPVQVAAQYERDGADELVFLDITASHEARSIMIDVVRRTADQVFMPLTVGEAFEPWTTSAPCYKRVATRFLSIRPPVKTPNSCAAQPSVLGVSASWSTSTQTRHQRRARILGSPHPWGANPTGLEAVSWAREVEKLGAGEIVLTCMDRDGTKDGYDLEMTAAVSQAVTIPVVASGGAGKPEHLADAIQFGKADAALAASIFHFGEFTIQETKEIMRQRGIPVRI